MDQLHGKIKLGDVDNIDVYKSYLYHKKIPQLFNKLLTQIIHDKPEDLNKHLIDQLNKIQYHEKHPNMQQSHYFTSEDFETMFDAYDIAGEGSLDYNCLVQALKIAGVKNPEEPLSADFPHIKTSSQISKPQFCQIMTALFNSLGYS